MYQNKYRLILKNGEQECPASDLKRKPGQRGKTKQTKARNLLNRLRDYENEQMQRDGRSFPSS